MFARTSKWLLRHTAAGTFQICAATSALISSLWCEHSCWTLPLFLSLSLSVCVCDTLPHVTEQRQEGRKFEFASRWAMKIVNPDWIFACIQQQIYIDEALFSVPSVPAAADELGLQPIEQ